MALNTLADRVRAAIEARKALAEAAEKAAPGPWVNTGQAGLGDAWQIHGAPSGEVQFKFDYEVDDSIEEPDDFTPGAVSAVVEVPVLGRVATLNYDEGGGVWAREAADHIVANQPSQIVRVCDADLATLEQCAVFLGAEHDQFACKLVELVIGNLAKVYGVTEEDG